MSGAKILAGLRDAVAGNFVAAIVEGQHWVREPEYRSIETAPKDGTEVLLPIRFNARAYWCDDLKKWVLSYPLHMETVPGPTKWLPSPPVTGKE